MLTAGLRGHASHGLCWSCSRGMPVMLAGRASHARGGMLVTDYAGHARRHASHARRGMPVTEEHALHAGGMLKA